MPELPEVETLRGQLSPLIVRRRVKEVRHGTHPRFSGIHAARGSLVRTLDRRGKYLLLGISHDRELVLHLGMTGQLLWGEQPEDHVHLGLVFTVGTLWFRDPRRFGRAVIVPAGDYSSLPTLSCLGPEPDSEEFTVRRVEEFLKVPGGPVKGRLLEQRLVAGVGNYIADEVLWHARVHPARRSLTADECFRVHRETRRIIRESLAMGGVSERDYLHVDGSRGRFGDRLAAHGRGGEPCLRCKTPLRHARVAGRGTVWCPSCQPAPADSRSRVVRRVQR